MAVQTVSKSPLLIELSLKEITALRTALQIAKDWAPKRHGCIRTEWQHLHQYLTGSAESYIQNINQAPLESLSKK